MKIFSFETLGPGFSVALFDGEKVHCVNNQVANKHVKELVIKADFLLKLHNCPYNSLDLLLVVNGPGSFTGIRAGLAAMEGMKAALNLPLKAVTAFEICAFKLRQLAHNIPEDSVFKIIFEGNSEEFYVQKFHYSLSPLSPPEIISKQDFTTDPKVIYGGTLGTKVNACAAGAIETFLYKRHHGLPISEEHSPLYMHPYQVVSLKKGNKGAQ